MAARFNYYTKKIHRYLGVFIGIQFLLWTVGGLYFSWTDIREIRGEHLRTEARESSPLPELASPSIAVSELKSSRNARSISGIRLARILGKPVYEISYLDAGGDSKTVLADAASGEIRGPVGEQEAVRIANAELTEPSPVTEVRLLTANDVGGHHEYREKPLPAWAVSYEAPENLVVYVAQDTGRVESLRTSSWRVFDAFWLVHTLDLYGRDNINNYVLRAFSVLGLVTIFSGYLLFFITSPWFRKRKTGTRD